MTGNPKGNFDPNADLTANTAIAGPLLSRFDLVFVLLDTPDKDWDKEISTYLLKQAISDDFGDELPSHRYIAWDINALRKYILFVRDSLQPQMTEAPRLLLLRYYQMQRQKDDRNASRTTVRVK